MNNLPEKKKWDGRTKNLNEQTKKTYARFHLFFTSSFIFYVHGAQKKRAKRDIFRSKI
jgi:hypothetical protein